VPCKKEFPQLVELHSKYAMEGLTAISVSLDEPEEKGKKERVVSFLTNTKATFTNFILDESQEFWQKKFDFMGPPCVFVFNRQGKWKQFKDIENYQEVEKYAVKCLKAR